MARLFGTDGVRGIANDSLTPELAYHLGRAAAYILGRTKNTRPFSSAGIPAVPALCWQISWRRYRFGWW